jgi:S1-C subfamily serine protease
MILMFRGLVIIAALLSIAPRAAAGQATSVLHIKVVLLDADRKPTPVPRHALLISDNPATATPRLVVTASDGTAEVRLRPGNYTVESDQPVTFGGKAYQWTETLDIVAGRDATLQLTVDNAEVGPTGSATTTGATLVEADPSSILAQWQQSVVALWTPTAHSSGFVIGADGLVVTSQRAIAAANSVAVQLTPSIKVAATILAADPVRDVAVLWIDPSTASSVRPVPLECAPAARPPVREGQKIVAIDAPFGREKDATPATVSRVAEHAIESDLVIAAGGEGGPVFTLDGVVGITSVGEEGAGRRHRNARVVRLDDVCEVVASARRAIPTAAPPGGTRLPVEPEHPFPVDALKPIVERRAGSLSPYQLFWPSFDVAFITPVMTYGAQHQAELNSRRDRSKGARAPGVVPARSPLMEFSNWSEYVAGFPPVLLVRVTPKLVEGFWTKVARGAAQTQGLSLPPIKRFKSGFSRMRAFCGEAEITPIHPFKLERRVSETDAIYEGLYAFHPDALGPSCASVRLMLYSEKEPQKPDTQVVDAKVLQQIWQDFEVYRVAMTPPRP